MNYSIPLYERFDGNHYFADLLKQGKYPHRNVTVLGFLNNGDLSVNGAAGATTSVFFDMIRGVVAAPINNANPNNVYFGNLRITKYCSAYAGAAPSVATSWLTTRKNNTDTNFLFDQTEYAAITPNPIRRLDDFLNVEFDLLRMDIVNPALVTSTVTMEFLFNGLVISYF